MHVQVTHRHTLVFRVLHNRQKQNKQQNCFRSILCKMKELEGTEAGDALRNPNASNKVRQFCIWHVVVIPNNLPFGLWAQEEDQ